MIFKGGFEMKTSRTLISSAMLTAMCDTNSIDNLKLLEKFVAMCVAETTDVGSLIDKDILDKMMEKRPEKRFESFAAIHEAIGKHDFLHMEISDRDKKIYQDFTDLVYESLISYQAEPHFNSDSDIFISKLEKVLATNLFETIIRKKSDVISSIVDCDYSYNLKIEIPRKTVEDFLEWFRNSTPQSQALILNNFISKISDIRVEEPEPELPF